MSSFQKFESCNLQCNATATSIMEDGLESKLSFLRIFLKIWLLICWSQIYLGIIKNTIFTKTLLTSRETLEIKILKFWFGILNIFFIGYCIYWTVYTSCLQIFKKLINGDIECQISNSVAFDSWIGWDVKCLSVNVNKKTSFDIKTKKFHCYQIMMMMMQELFLFQW